MILTGKYVSKLARIAQRHPRLVMIIDHLSVQHANTVAEAFGAYEEILAVARFPGIHIKVGNAPNASRHGKPRGCDLVSLRVCDVIHGNQVISRAMMEP